MNVLNIKKLSKNQLVKETLIYGITNALYTGLPLLLMPFLVATLSPEEYGIVELFRSITMVLVPVLGLSTVQSVSRFYFDLNEKEFKNFSSSLVLFQIINGIIGILIILSFSFLLEEKYKIIAYLSVIYFIFNQVTEILMATFRVRKQPKKYMVFRLLNVVLDLSILATFFVIFEKYSWTFRVFPKVIAVILVGFLALWWFFYKEKYKFILDKKLLKIAVVYSAPLILHMLSGYMLNVGDRFFILYFLDERALGNYSVAYQISLGVSFLYTSFNLAWTPTFYEWMKLKNYKAIRRVKNIIFTGIPFLGVGSIILFFILKEIIPNLKEYNIDYKIIILLVIANVILCFYKFYANYYFYNKRTKILSVITMTSAMITIALNFFLIPELGILGAAFTTLITFAVMLFLILSKLNNYEKN